jgi:hypothetical protein
MLFYKKKLMLFLKKKPTNYGFYPYQLLQIEVNIVQLYPGSVGLIKLFDQH